MVSERKSIIELLKKSKGYDIALLTTFNFDVPFFEREVLNTLYQNDIRKISIFVDDRQFEETLNDDSIYDSHLGEKYIVSRVQTQGAFHPKLILLLAKDKARLIVASSNLTLSGYETNNEIFNVIDYNDSQPKFLDCILEAINYFDLINEISDGFDSDLIKELKEYSYFKETNNNGERKILHNYDKSMLEQIISIVGSDVTDVKIAVPYYDKDVVTLTKIKELYSNANISLYVQQEKSTFPVEHKDEFDVKVFDSLRKYTSKEEKDNDNIKYLKNFYHGKVFFLRTNKDEYILYGSPNCTQSAFIKSYLDGGNLECAILDKGNPGEFDSFFDNFVIKDEIELKSSPMIFKEKPVINKFFRFVSAKSKDDYIICKIKNIKGLIDYKISFQGSQLDVKEEDGIITVKVQQTNNVFDLDISFEDKKETLKCWVIDKHALEMFRMSDKEKKLVVKEDVLDSGYEEFFEYTSLLFDAESNAEMEFKENHKKSLSTKKDKTEEYDDKSDEYFTVVQQEEELEEEYAAIEKRYSSLSKARSMFFNFKLHVKSNSEHTFTKQINSGERNTSHTSTLSGVEKYIRFVKRHTNKITDKEVNAISLEHYIQLISVLDVIYKKEYGKEDKKMIFEASEIVDASIHLFDLLVDKICSIIESGNISEVDGELIKIGEEYILASILENHIIIDNQNDYTEKTQLDLKQKQLLKKLNKKLSVRNKLDEYIQSLLTVQDDDTYRHEVFKYYDFDSAKQYINELFGYRTNEDVLSFIKDWFDGEVKTELENSILRIEYNTDDIRSNLKPDTKILSEIKNTAREEKSIKRVIFVINNTKFTNKKHISQVTHKVSLDLFSGNNWDCIIEYSDGEKLAEKSKKVLF